MSFDRFNQADQPNETQTSSRGFTPSTADWRGFNANREESWNGANQSLISNNVLPSMEIGDASASNSTPNAGGFEYANARGDNGEHGWHHERHHGHEWQPDGGESSSPAGNGGRHGWHHHGHESQCGGESSSPEGNSGGGDPLVDKLLSDPTMLQTLENLQGQMTPQGFSALEQSLVQNLSANPSVSDSALMQQAFQQLSGMGASSQDLAALQNLLGAEGGTTTSATPPGGDGSGTTTIATPTGGDGSGTTTIATPTGGDGSGTTTIATPTGGDGSGTTITTTPPAGDSSGTTATTTPIPATSTSGAPIPDAPASLNAPTKLVLDDEFNTGSLNTNLWSPNWFGNGNTQNGTVMDSSNVSVDQNGLELKLNSNNTGGIVTSNPDDGQPGHTGFQIAPTPGHPVYVEYTANLPAAQNGQIANWPALWLTGQNWPMTGEIDVMEGFGNSQYHVITGSSPSQLTNPGGVGGTTPGEHTYGVLWSTTGETFVYDGQVVGQENVPVSGPMFLAMENSSSYGPTGLPSSPTTMTVNDVRVYQD